MASTYSTSLRLELIGTGEQSGTWGQTTNVNLGTLIEQAIGGYESIALSDANYTLSALNGVSDQSRNMALRFTGTLSANRNIVCPDFIEKLYVVENATSGGYALVFKTASGTGTTIPNGAKAILAVDGTNVTSVAVISAAGAALIDDADAAAQRTTLGLGTIATQAANNVAITGGSISGATITGGSISGITDLAVADGGTGSSTAAGARTNLGAAASGVNTDITSVALNNTGLTVRDTDASHVLSIVPGSNLSTNRTFTLTTGDANRTLNISAADVTISTAGAALIDDADAAAQRTTLGLGTIATQAANNVSITGGSISGITDLAIADGGTGASTVSAARTNFGLGTGDSPTFTGITLTSTSLLGSNALTTASTSGFAYIPAVGDMPTGLPDTYPGRAPLVFDSSTGSLYIFANGSWVKPNTSYTATNLIGTETQGFALDFLSDTSAVRVL